MSLGPRLRHDHWGHGCVGEGTKAGVKYLDSRRSTNIRPQEDKLHVSSENLIDEPDRAHTCQRITSSRDKA